MNWVKTSFLHKENKKEFVQYSARKSNLSCGGFSQDRAPERNYTHTLQAYHTKYLDILKNDFKATYSNPPTSKRPIDDFDQVKVIGSGSFSTVYLVRNVVTFTYHAMKVIDKQAVIKKNNLKSIFTEKKILQSVNFPFLTTLDYTSKDNMYVYFILPFESGGELYTLVRRLGSLSEPLQLFYAAQIVLALEYLHHCGVVHRDVKPENVLICESGYIKLGDFGFSKMIKKRTWTLCGTPEYLAPELIMSHGYTFSVDWWSMGVLIYEMCAGYPPFVASDPMKMYTKILTGNFKTPDCMTLPCKSLLKCLLEVDPTKRFGSLKSGVYDIKSHAWFQEIDWNVILHKKMIPPYFPVYRNGEADYPFAEETIRVFRALEYPAELAKQEFHRERLVFQRQYLIQFVVEFTGNNSEELSEHLALYERVLEEASDGGLSLDVKGNFPPAEEKWSILQAVFFASTVLTTIGYGNIVPETFWGRLFCIAYALIGIPLTLTVIADLGKAFATVVSVIAKQLPPMPKCCSKVSEANPTGQRSLYALGAVGFLFLYLSAGAGLFKMWEDDWTFYDGFYFCFITMTTIGFGDLVPKKPKYMLLCTLYILIGLALTSTIIELVRRQYARSWQQLRALSGPLADTLRRLGDAGLGVDVSSLHSDLRKVLTVVTLSRLSMSGANGLSEKRQMEWEAAMVEAVIRDVTSPAVEKKPPVVQIVIYESSV